MSRQFSRARWTKRHPDSSMSELLMADKRQARLLTASSSWTKKRKKPTKRCSCIGEEREGSTHGHRFSAVAVVVRGELERAGRRSQSRVQDFNLSVEQRGFFAMRIGHECVSVLWLPWFSENSLEVAIRPTSRLECLVCSKLASGYVN